ncbi:MAG TPA: DUF1259 domain-containing protein [Gemmatimonadales bacterium]|jgi:hypothetical protein|nr:DUF1259 domain-containing protein [Gemmatimonadales bacterium]
MLNRAGSIGVILTTVVVLSCLAAELASARQALDWKPVAQALGRPGALQPGDVYRVSLPRSDLRVMASGVRLKPAFALGSWVAFKQTGPNEAMLMGDLVLTEAEVARVMSKLQDGNIRPTALHNHVLHETPRVLYMHITGRGEPARLAAAVRAALALSKTPLENPAAASPAPALFALDTAQISRAVGAAGKLNGGVYQLSVPRAESITLEGMEVPPAMGVATAINFQPTTGARAAITGDFVLLDSEVNSVIQALRHNGIEVTAIHSHMLGETPRLFFMHFWANDDAVKLANGLRAALDKTNRR